MSVSDTHTRARIHGTATPKHLTLTAWRRAGGALNPAHRESGRRGSRCAPGAVPSAGAGCGRRRRVLQSGPRTRGQSGTRPGAVSLGGPGRPPERMRLPGRGQPARPWASREEVEGEGAAPLSLSELVRVGALAAALVVAQQGHSPGLREPPLAALLKPPRATRACGARKLPASGNGQLRLGNLAKVPAAAQRRREAAREEAGTTQVGPAGRRGKRVAVAGGRGGRGGPRRWGPRARRGCRRDGKRRGKRAGEGTGWGPAGGAPRRGAGTRGTDPQAGSWASGRAPPPSPLRAACPPRSPGTAPTLPPPPSNLLPLSDWGEASTRGREVGS